MGTTEIKITNKEFEAYCNTGGSYVSDIDYGMDAEGKFTVPAVEWESAYGSHWQRYESEADRGEALDQHEDQMAYWVEAYREEKKQAIAKKREESKKIAQMKTIGGQFPELEKLLGRVA